MSNERDKKSKVLEDFQVYKEFVEEEQRRRKQRKLILATLVFIVYLLFASFWFGRGILFNRSFSSDIVGRVDSLIIEQQRINSRLTHMEELLKTTATTTAMSLRLSKNEADLRILQDTILRDPDQAITARLLREKQEELNRNLADVKTDVGGLASQVDRIFWAILVFPALGFVAYLFREKLFKRL